MSNKVIFHRASENDEIDVSETALRRAFGRTQLSPAMRADWRLVNLAQDETTALAYQRMYQVKGYKFAQAMKSIAEERPLLFALSQMQRAPSNEPADVELRDKGAR